MDSYDPLEDLYSYEVSDDFGNKALYPSMHLDVPLRGQFYIDLQQYLQNADYFKDKADFRKGRVEDILSLLFIPHFKTHFPSFMDADTNLDPSQLNFTLFHSLKLEFQGKHHEVFNRFWTSLKSATNIFNLQEEAIEILTPKTLKDHILIRNTLIKDRLFNHYFLLSKFFRECVVTMNLLKSKGKLSAPLHFTMHYGKNSIISGIENKIKFITSGEGGILYASGQYSILSKETVLSMSDLAHQRLNLLISGILADLKSDLTYLHRDHLEFIFKWGDFALTRFGRKAFGLLKNFEGICTSALLERNEEHVCDSEKFYINLLEGVVEEFGEQGALEVNSLMTFLRALTTDQVSQSFGLFRIWGHPVVKGLDGITKVKSKGKEIKYIPPELPQSISNMFKLLFIKGYRAQHGRWPKVSLDNSCSRYLKDCHKSNASIDAHHPNFDLKDMKNIQLEKNFSCDPTYNLSTAMSDKALSLSKTKLLKNIKKYKNIGRSEDRRVILEWLKSNHTSPAELLEDIDRNGFSAEDLVIGLVPKEREMKTEPRLFAILTLKARLYFVLTEALLSDHILKYFPQITMTLSGSDLIKKLFSVSKRQKGSSEFMQHITMNIDFEKWNINMRGFLTSLLFKNFDELFGFNNVFQRTHEFFYNSWIYLADEEANFELTPDGKDFVENAYAWKGHLGGFEGQRQKGWTIATVCLIELEAMPGKLEHQLIGQGDNQVLLVSIKVPYFREMNNRTFHENKIPNYEVAKRRFEDFRARFLARSRQAGLPIKEEETWESTALFAYGKNLFFKSVPLSMSQKRLARMFPMANQDFPTIENEISTIFGAGSAAVSTDLTVTIPFLMSLLIAGESILSSLNYSIICNESIIAPLKSGVMLQWKGENRLRTKITCHRVLKTDVEQEYFLYYALLRPKILGGFPIQNILNFVSRGFPDPLTESLSLLRKLENLTHHDTYLQSIIISLMRPRLRDSVSPLMLLQDPVSVNVKTVGSATRILKSESLSYLRSLTVLNHHFRTMLDIPATQYDLLAAQLISLNPYHSFLMSDILDASLPGYAQSIINKISKTTTILDQTARKKGKSMFVKIMLSEKEYFHYHIAEFNVIPFLPNQLPIQCSTVHAQFLRNAGWKKEILGVTIPHPIEFLQQNPVDNMEGCEVCSKDPNLDHLRIDIDSSIQSDTAIFLSQIGPNSPYIGSETVEKTKKLIGGNLVNTEPLIKRSINLQRAINWFVPRNSPAAQLIRNLLLSVTDLNPELFSSIEGETTGSEHHRYHSLKSVRAGLIATSYRLATFLAISTNSLYSYKKGKENTTLHFQAMMVTYQHILSQNIVNMSRFKNYLPFSGFHYHLDCPSCIQPVDDKALIGDDKWSKIIFPKAVTPYTWLPQESANIEYQYHINSFNMTELTTEETSVDHQILSTYWRITSVIVSELLAARFSSGSAQYHTLPVIWTAKANPILLLESFVAYFFCWWVSHVCVPPKTHLSFDSIYRSFLQYVEATNSNSFYFLANIFLDSEERLLLLNSVYEIQPPTAITIQMGSAAIAVKNAVTKIISSPHFDIQNIMDRIPSMMLYERLNVIEDLTIIQIKNWVCSGCLFNIFPVLTLIREFQSSVYLNPNEQLDIYDSWTKFLHNKQLFLGQKEFIKSFFKSNVYVLRISIDYGVKLFVKDPSYKSNNSPPPSIDYIAVFQLTQLKKEQAIKEPARILRLPGLQYSIFSSNPSGILCPALEHELNLNKITYESLFHRVPALDTSAWMKFASIQPYLCNTRPKVILCCGDGTGGIGAYCLAYYPTSCLIFNSLITLKGILPHSAPNSIPSSFSIFSDLTRLLNKDQITDRLSDITHPHFPSYINSLALEKGGIDLIVCDAEGVGWENPDFSYSLSANLIRTSLTTQGMGNIVMKTYIKNPLAFLLVYYEFSKYFDNIFVVRSPFSSINNSEVYLVAEKKKQGSQYVKNTLNISHREIVGLSKGSDYDVALSFIQQFSSHFSKLEISEDHILTYQTLGLKLFGGSVFKDSITKVIGQDSFLLLMTLLQKGSTLEFQDLLRTWWNSRTKEIHPFFLKNRSAMTRIMKPPDKRQIGILSIVLITLMTVGQSSLRSLKVLKAALKNTYFVIYVIGNSYRVSIFVNSEQFTYYHQTKATGIYQDNKVFICNVFKSLSPSYSKMLYRIAGSVRLMFENWPHPWNFKGKTLETYNKGQYLNLDLVWDLDIDHKNLILFSPYCITMKEPTKYINVKVPRSQWLLTTSEKHTKQILKKFGKIPYKNYKIEFGVEPGKYKPSENIINQLDILNYQEWEENEEDTDLQLDWEI